MRRRTPGIGVVTTRRRAQALAMAAALAALPLGGPSAQVAPGSVLPPGALAPFTSPVERVLPREQPEIVPPARVGAEPAAPAPAGPPIRVDDIRIEGVTVYDPADLRSNCADAIGNAVPRARLAEIVQPLQTRYRDDGYILTLVRGQFERSGDGVVLTIRVIEGHIKTVKLDDG